MVLGFPGGAEVKASACNVGVYTCVHAYVCVCTHAHKWHREDVPWARGSSLYSLFSFFIFKTIEMPLK